MSFAEAYPRTEEGWIIFPEDADLRKSYFPPEVMGHPAKANLYMVEAIVEHVSEEGETILDPMSGTGSILIAAALKRKVICIEVEEGYWRLQTQSAFAFPASTTLIHGDCLKILPLPTDHIIFSPPYAGVLKMRGGAKRESTRALAGSTYQDTIQDYSENPANIGRLSKFLYNQVMEKVYGLCYESLRPGGTMTVILQDYYDWEYKERRRILLSDWLLRTCIRIGFEQSEWHKRLARGTGFKQLWKSRGYEVVSDEDIVMFRKGLVKGGGQ